MAILFFKRGSDLKVGLFVSPVKTQISIARSDSSLAPVQRYVNYNFHCSPNVSVNCLSVSFNQSQYNIVDGPGPQI